MLTGLTGPSWTWQSADTAMLVQGFIIGTVGIFLSFALLGASALEQHLRQQERTGGKDVTEATLLLDHRDGADARPIWRRIFLLLVGLSPLTSCVVVGESLDNVLLAMVVMHWICMLVLPALYYAIRFHEEEGLASSTVAFYRDVFDGILANTFSKFLRGCLFGLLLFVCLVTGYVAFRCKTLNWLFCFRRFDRPLEETGVDPHSMPFRILAATYFTIWNPFIEEFFWRVFLHREMGCELGLKTEESRMMSEGGQVEAVRQTLETNNGAWWNLWQELVELLPSGSLDDASRTSALVRWGVSFLFASYHTWPMKVLFLSNHVWWLHILGGFLFLACLGRFLLLLRESSADFGLPAAYACHVWIDAAFAVLCLCKINVHEVLETSL